jgi:hypothetical protein
MNAVPRAPDVRPSGRCRGGGYFQSLHGENSMSKQLGRGLNLGAGMMLSIFCAWPVAASQVGLWNFDNNLNNALPGKAAMTVNGAWTPAYVSETINGSPATVLSFPGFDDTQSLQMLNEAPGNGGGVNTNTWSVVMDVKFPSIFGFVALWQTDQILSGSSDGDFFIRNNGDGIGIGGQYDGVFNENTWHRVAVTIHADVPLDDSVLLKYIDGVYVGDSFSGVVPDGRHSVPFQQFLHFFADEDFETIDGLVNSIAYYDRELTEAEIAALGGASASGIPVEVSGIDGDFDNNGLYNCADIDALTNAVASGGSVANFDLNGDNMLSILDVDAWRAEAGDANNVGTSQVYKVGDANLDGVVDGTDFGLWNSNKFTNNKDWCKGNFNADAVTDGSDFGLWNSNKFTASDGSVVPEPSMAVLLLLAAVPFGLRRK